MKTQYNLDTKHAEAFTKLVVLALFVVMAWGNALAMLVYAFVSLAAWFSLPYIRDEEAQVHRVLLTGVIAAALAAGIVILNTLMNGT
jgi:hypothetical protein